MFNFKEYYQPENVKVREAYNISLARVKEICAETACAPADTAKKDLYQFFHKTAENILFFADFEDKLDDDYFTSDSFENLQNRFNRMSDEILPENFKSCYANPVYAVQVFGEELGKVIYPLYQNFRNYRAFAFEHKVFVMAEHNALFINLFEYVKNNDVQVAELKELVVRFKQDIKQRDVNSQNYLGFSREFSYYRDIIADSDLNELNYLLKYNSYITENEIKTARFFQNYPEDKLKVLSRQIAKAYVDGFVTSQKDITKKSTVKVIFQTGQEILIKQLLKDLQEYKLTALLSKPISSDANKQLAVDFKFENALYFDEGYANKFACAYEKSMEVNQQEIAEFSGVILIEKFGEKPFSPENKKEALSYSPEQQQMMQGHFGKLSQIRERFMPRNDTSFCIIAFPTPEIGENFQEIFEDIMEVNMLESAHYHKIQKHIIDVLDKADHVHIKGCNGNETDLTIKLQKLVDPAKETNFCNCGADVNIPVGEVFTSPQLEGTNGMLHLKETFLKDLNFKEFKMEFKDGYSAAYSCGNYDDDEANKKYIADNLLFPNKTLPIGEFAIGTNTLAYKIAKKYDIVNILPILIIEKMGPHFAIGDTCFSHTEDAVSYNPIDNKEIKSKDNSKSLLRKTDMSQAYTFCHTDITLPYEELAFITAISESGESFDIIRDGRFVVPGTEELNIPLDEMEKEG